MIWSMNVRTEFRFSALGLSFGAIWAQTPFFGLFYLKSYDDEIWYVGALCDLEYECPNGISIFDLGPLGANPVFRTFRFVQRLRVGLSARRRRVSIRPNVLLAVSELFVRPRSARSQARRACGIARRRLVLI